MRRRYSIAGAAVVAAACAALLLSQTGAEPGPPLSSLMPAGALLYAEARDLKSLETKWESSAERKTWMEGADYAAFTRSNLYQKLDDAAGGLAGIARLKPGAAVADLAGSESALALYDIGELHFLYVTRMPESQALETALWKGRVNMAPREAGGTAFYTRAGTSGKTLSFASAKGLLLVATREDLIAGALEILAGTQRNHMTDEAWYARPVSAAGKAGDVRLVMDMAALARSPHFRSHWIQNNTSELKQNCCGVSDLFLDAAGIREERVFVKNDGEQAEAATGALGEALALVPEDAGFYRGWASPGTESVAAMLATKLLAPGANSQPEPQRSQRAAIVSDDSLDVRIDEPEEAAASPGASFAGVRDALAESRITAAVQVEEARPAADGVFFRTSRALILLRETAWDAQRVRGALRTALDGLWTTAGGGQSWKERAAAGSHYAELDGLAQLAVAVDGKRLIVANQAGLMERILARREARPVAAATYAACFRHGAQRKMLAQWARQLDSPSATAEGGAPQFFSGNLASLSEALAKIGEARISIREESGVSRQSVFYAIER